MVIVVFVSLFAAILAPRVAALECYSCDSAEDVECATQPGQQLNVEECSSADDVCVTNIMAGITRRGCLSRLYPNKYCPAPCERCSRNLCNRDVFPSTRLRCFQCLGSNCVDVRGKQAALVRPCPVYGESDRCYTNVIGLNNVQRGCEHTNLPAACPNVCLKCNYDGCNDELGVHEDSCLQCSHTTFRPQPDCLRSQLPGSDNCSLTTSAVSRCSNKLLHGHRGRCFTYINAQTGVVQRGCSTIMGFYPTGNLTECFGANCNSACLAIACNSCDTALLVGDELAQSNCRRGLNLRPQQCSASTVACYSCALGSHVRRGCADGSFMQAPDESCHQCRSGDGCNRAIIRTCFQCTSLGDSNCATFADATRVTKQECTAVDELCVSTLMTKYDLVYAVRGCASQVGECTASDPLCVRCNGSLCNNAAMSWLRQGNTDLALLKDTTDAVEGRSGSGRYLAPLIAVVLCIFLSIGKYESINLSL